MIKYKKAESPGWYYKIDTATEQKISFNQGKPGTSAAGLYKEMLAWVAGGNEIEPQYTDEELLEKEAQDALDAQDTINSTARTFLSNSDWKITRHRDQLDNGDPPSLTATEFKALLTERQTARDSVIDQ